MLVNKTNINNLISITFGWLIPSAIFFFLTPYLVLHLGVEKYGIFALTNLLTGYVGLLNFGVGQAITQKVSFAVSRNDLKLLNQTISSGGIFFFTIGGISLVVIFFAAEFIAKHIFNIPENLVNESINTFRISSLGFFLFMINEYFRGIALGYNNFKIPYFTRIIRTIFSTIFIVLAIALYKNNLYYVVFGNVVGLFLAILVNAFMLYKLIKKFHFILSVNNLKDILHYGKFVFGSKAINNFTTNIGTLLLGIVASVGNLTYYDIPMKISSKVSELIGRLLELLFPITARLEAENNRKKLNEIYVKISVMQWSILILLFLIFLFNGEFLLKVWLTEEFMEKSFLILIGAVLYNGFSLSTTLPSFFALGLGYPNLNFYFTLIRSAIIIAVIYPLLKIFGALGLVFALIFGEIQGVIYVFFFAKRYLKIKLFSLLKYKIFTLFAITLIYVGGFVFLKINGLMLYSWKGQLSITLLIIITYSLLIYHAGIIDFSLFKLKKINFRKK